MICGNLGRVANAKATRFPLSNDEAKGIVDAMKERVKGTWYEVTWSVEVSENDCERISNAFADPGFDLEQVWPVDGE